MEVATALSDDNIRHAFEKAQALHSNFYECRLQLEDVIIGAEDVKTAVGKLLSLIPQEN